MAFTKYSYVYGKCLEFKVIKIWLQSFIFITFLFEA